MFGLLLKILIKPAKIQILTVLYFEIQEIYMKIPSWDSHNHMDNHCRAGDEHHKLFPSSVCFAFIIASCKLLIFDIGRANSRGLIIISCCLSISRR